MSLLNESLCLLNRIYKLYQMAQIISVNRGLPKEVVWQERIVLTGIYKYPTGQPVQIFQLGLEGDGQGDLIHHGGLDKAVYAYPKEHYSYWQTFLNKENLEAAMFGENLTTEGIMETEVYMGDYWQFGTAVLMAVQPRMPCSKLGLRFGDARMTQYFARGRRNGIYFRVIQEGMVQAGDAIQRVKRSAYDITIQDVVDSYASPKKNIERIDQIMSIPFLPQLLKSSFAQMTK